ncbi:hypothetical protein BU16DRAFT_618564 [Lophium mytilinum]|uniref:Mediator of RNA polymerase II transcription subunit 13 n=1 Tax=Lophium mytilinum TaxID=390894 RepID=A0A6A6QQP7_9PEZI|nr:hypothetical protein BU16DRAFT_618564 [Lophium mytilinum]
MEFVKTCNTNVQAVGEFEAVAYQAFSIKRTANSPPSPSDEKTGLAADLGTVECTLRQARHLVLHDTARSWLWLFRPITPEKATQTPAAPPIVDGYAFHAEISGLVRAAELARAPARPSNPPTSATSTNAPPSALRSNQAGNLRATQANSQISLAFSGSGEPQQYDVYAVYELLMSSVVASISYSLARDHGMIPLNYRTFVSFSIAEPRAKSLESDFSDKPSWLTSVDVHWTSAGSLVISTSSKWRPDMHQLSSLGPPTSKVKPGSVVRTAPSGNLAVFLGLELSGLSNGDNENVREQRKRPRIKNEADDIHNWKTHAKSWLARKGLGSFVQDYGTKPWARIQIASDTIPSELDSPSLANQAYELLWPSGLCFSYDSSKQGWDPAASVRTPLGLEDHLTSQNSAEQGLDWFQTPESMGYQDPLDLAQQWFCNKPERDKAQEARRKAQQAEEEAQTKDDSNVLYPSSPLYSRTGAWGDLQPVSGVYPTPPDGVAPQGPVVSSAGDIPHISGPIGSMDGMLSQDSNPRSSDLPGTNDADGTGLLGMPGTSPKLSHPFDSQPELNFSSSLHGGNDDLFEDMDEDTFDGNGVTDADFNFFDEPDGDDFGDMDGVQGTNDDAQPEETSQQQAGESHDQKEDLKVEPASEPLAQVGNATDRHLDLRPGKRLQSDPNQPEYTESKPGEESTRVLAVDEPIIQSPEEEEHVPSPPLSPKLIIKKLLPRPDGMPNRVTSEGRHKTPVQRKGSIFDPLAFNTSMSLADSKYSGGRFHFPESEGGDASSLVSSKSQTPLSKRQKPTSQHFSVLLDLRGSLGRKGTIMEEELPIDEGDISDTSSGDLDSEPEIRSPKLDSLPIVPSWPTKRKWIADETATPLSVTSFADSKLGGDSSEHILGRPLLQTDQACLGGFEPSPWDWSLVSLPSPSERHSSVARADVAFPSPGLSPMPTTLSQIEISPSDEKVLLSGKDMIAVAQILTDQIVSSTLDILNDEGGFVSGSSFGRPLEGDALDPSKTVQDTVRQLFEKAVDCDVTKLVCVQDVFPDIPQAGKGHLPKAVPRRMNTYGQGDGNGSPGHLIYPVAPPHIRVRRSDALWDLLPTALSFWEPLGLAPTSGPKNIITYCVYPHSESLTARVETFLNNLGIVYEGCKLGTHVRSDAIEDFQGGLVPTRVTGPATKRTVLQALRETCRRLGEELSQSYLDMREKDDSSKIDAFVIYMVDPFAEPAALWELCSAFWALFGSYGQGAQANTPRPDLVLQIVPMKYIASFDAPVVLEPTTLMSLAREVYDRCPPSAVNSDKTPLSIFSAPSIQLEEALPRNIQFKLASDPPADLLRENSYMHLGYAISLDGAWITAAWTDSCGKSQAVVSYSSRGRPFNEIAREIWQTTIEILHSRRVTWRICIAKAGVMEREEIEAWILLASSPTQLNLFITLLTVDANPPLSLTPTLPTVPTAAPSRDPNASTPVSTPQPGVSPDQHGLTPAATPSDAIDPSADPDARLVDVTDETWGLILSHRLHNSHSTIDYRPALISGLIVKRGSGSTTPSSSPSSRGPLVINVNILWVGAVGGTRAATSPFPATPGASDGVSPGAGTERSSSSMSWTSTAQSRSTAENLLKEVLGQFRGLGLLARLRGVRGCRHGVVPWHVAVARRGAEGVGRCVD